MSDALDQIQSALDKRLDEGALMLPIAWENTTFEPSVTQAYLRPTFLPAQPSAASIGLNGRNRQAGIYQVDVFVPVGGGSAESRRISGRIIDLFKRGTVLGLGDCHVQVESAGRRPARTEPDWYHVPVIINWFAYAQN